MPAIRRLLKALGAKDKTVVTAFIRRPQLLTAEGGTALECYQRFCSVLSGFGIKQSVAAKVSLRTTSRHSCKGLRLQDSVCRQTYYVPRGPNTSPV